VSLTIKPGHIVTIDADDVVSERFPNELAARAAMEKATRNSAVFARIFRNGVSAIKRERDNPWVVQCFGANVTRRVPENV